MKRVICSCIQHDKVLTVLDTYGFYNGYFWHSVISVISKIWVPYGFNSKSNFLPGCLNLKPLRPRSKSRFWEPIITPSINRNPNHRYFPYGSQNYFPSFQPRSCCWECWWSKINACIVLSYSKRHLQTITFYTPFVFSRPLRSLVTNMSLATLGFHLEL